MYYLLDENKKPYSVDLVTWSAWMEKSKMNRHVRDNYLMNGDIRVSTVFLGLDHSYKSNIPILFETMIFWDGNERLNQYQQRYTTWDEALKGHRKAMKMVIKVIRENSDKAISIPAFRSLDEICDDIIKSITDIERITATSPIFRNLINNLLHAKNQYLENQGKEND